LIRRNGEEAVRANTAAGLSNTDFVLGSTEDSASSGLLFEHLLIVRVRIAYLDDMFLSTVLRDRGVVELPDDLLADVS
jgi:hypothetical protein